MKYSTARAARLENKEKKEKKGKKILPRNSKVIREVTGLCDLITAVA